MTALFRQMTALLQWFTARFQIQGRVPKSFGRIQALLGLALDMPLEYFKQLALLFYLNREIKEAHLEEIEKLKNQYVAKVNT